MKKIFILLLAGAISAASFSQDGNLKKQTYFRVGFSIPTWKFYGFSGKNDFPDDIKRTGGVFETGSIFMLNGIKLADGMRIGINVDYLSIGLNRFSLNDDNNYIRFIYAGTKIGPSFSYSPVKHLVFDAFFKINPVWAAAQVYTDKEDDSNNEMYLGFLGWKYSVGLNVRYSVLMLGFEFNPGFSKLRYYDKENNKLTDEYEYSADGSKKIKIPCMNFTLGFSF